MVLSLLFFTQNCSLLHAAGMISSFDTAENSLKWGGIAPQGKLHRKISRFSGFVWFVNWFDLNTFTHFHAFSINKNKTTGLQEEQILTMTWLSNNYNHWFLFISLPLLFIWCCFLFFTQETPPNQQTSPISSDRFRLQKFICLRCGADVDTIADWLRIDQVTPHDTCDTCVRRRTGGEVM